MIQNRHILIHNIYYMLSYAFQALNRSDDEDMAPEAFENIHSLFAAILSKGIGMQLKQGLYRSYLNRREDLATLRGRIAMPGTIRNRLARRQALACEYDELSENNLFNQILKTTAQLLIRHGQVKPPLKDALRQKLLFFSGVDAVDPLSIRWGDIRFQRSNQSYRMLLGICQLTIEGMLLTTETGERRLAAFLDDQRMCRLYEKFLLEYYVQHHPALAPRAAQIPWALDDGAGALLPVMQTDITLQRGNRVLIIDAKYYSHTLQSQYDRYTVHSGNLYQIFTYVKNREYAFGNAPHSVSGLLLYARTDEATQPDNTYAIHGSRISVGTLDLRQPFGQIRSQLDQIADEMEVAS